MSQLDPISESNELSGAEQRNGSNGALATIESHLPAVPSLGWPYGPPQRPEILTSKPNPLELYHAVRRRMPLAIGLGLLVGGLAAGLVWFFVPVRYEAFALLRVAEKPGQVLAKQGEAGTAFEIFKRTQVQLILSPMVLRRTVGEQEISKLSMIKANDDDPVSYLKDQMILDYPDNSEILRVAIKGQKKEELVKIVDMVVKKYLTEVVQHEREQRLEQENKLEKRYSEYFQDFTKQSNNLHTMEQLAKTSSTEAAQVKRRLAEDRLIDAICHLSRHTARNLRNGHESGHDRSQREAARLVARSRGDRRGRIEARPGRHRNAETPGRLQGRTFAAHDRGHGSYQELDDQVDQPGYFAARATA